MDSLGFLFYLLISFCISLISTLALIRICYKYDLLDYPGKHKRHKKPVPYLGGAAIFISVWAVALSFIYLKNGIFNEIREPLPYILAGSLLIFLIGLIDDIKPVPAIAKLLVQIVAGLILYYGGLSVDLISIPLIGSAAAGNLSIAMTVLWVVALSNAINLIDGLDGLAVGVSIIAGICLAIIGYIWAIESVVLISLTMVGALGAFLIFNRYPARIFLGDSGSLLIGYFFAVISLIVPIKSFTTAALFMPLVVLGVPLTEAASSFLRRLAMRKSFMKADRRHIFHYLSYAGLNQKQIVYLFYLVGLVFGLISISMTLFDRLTVLTILILFMVVIFIIYFIFIGRIKKKPSFK